ncbi:MAG: HAD family hydrolase [Verrucomicrobiota bacterium]
MRSISFIYLDLDDTLLDHSGAVRRATASYLQDYQNIFPHTPEEFYKEWCELIENYYFAYLRGDITYEQQRIYRIKEMYHRQSYELNDSQAQEHFNHYLYHYENNWKLFDDVAEFFNKCPLKKGIITNGNSAQQRKKIDRLGLSKLVDPIIISDEVGFAKPESAIFLEACQQAKVDPQYVLYVGDRLQADIIGSKKAGLTPIWIRRYSSSPAQGHIPFIQSLCELDLNKIGSSRFNTRHLQYAHEAKDSEKSKSLTR